MKRFVIIFLILFTALLSACGEDTTTVSGDTSSKGMEKSKENERKNKDVKKVKEEKDVEAEKKPNLEPEYFVNPKNWLVQPINDSLNEKVVLLTIDDAPDEHALEMAKTLNELNAGAIFFVNGHFLDTPEEKDTLKKIYNMGFMIGNHTYNHPFLPDLSTTEQKKEIVELNELIKEIIGEKPLFFRAPNGANTDFSMQLAKEEGMTVMNWTYGYDWNKSYSTKESITDIMLHTNLLVDGANLLMHDREWTAKALHDIVIGLRNQGYEILDPHQIKTK